MPQTNQIILLGPPGSGKSTQARLISQYYDIEHIQTGAILRDMKHTETQWGTPGEYIDNGERPPNPMVDRLVVKKLSSVSGFVLDGYPRDMSQAEILEKETDVETVIYLEVTKERLIQRLRHRLQCQDCQAIYNQESRPPPIAGKCGECGGDLIEREDDKIGAIETRVKEYNSDIEQVVSRYSNKGILTRIDGQQSVDEVWRDIQDTVEGSSHG